MTPRTRRLPVALAVLAALVWVDAAAAAPTITMRWTGGLGGGLSAGAGPHTITRGNGDIMWFTESTDPGGVARATNGVGEFRAGSTPGFTVNARPHRIAIGPDGEAWFSASADPGRLFRITNTGAITEFVGGVTPGFSPNGVPAGLTAGPDGNLWMVQTRDPGRINRVTPAGVFTELTGGVTPGLTANSFPADIAVGPDGRLWVAQAARGFARVDPATLAVSELVPGVTPGLTANLGPQKVVLGPDGAMWATAATAPGRIVRIAPGDQVTEFTAGITPGFTPGAGPTGIAAGPDGNLWFVKTGDPGTVARIKPTGEVTEFRGGVAPGLPANGFPISIAAGYDGAMWFTMAAAPGRIGHITVGPGVVSGTAADVRDTSVRLRGTVRPNGQVTTYRFEYGRTTEYGSQTPLLGADSGLDERAVAQSVTGLRPNTTYHWRLVATNESDTTRGEDRTFRTGAPGRPGTAGADTGPVGTVPALLTRLRVSRAAFRAAPSGSAVGRLRAPRRGRVHGTVVSFRVDRSSPVRFRVRRCLNRRCTRTRLLSGSFTRSGRVGSSNRFRFTGRLAGRTLARGRYRLVATPRGGSAKRVAFRVVG